MTKLRILSSRVLALFTKRRRDADLNEEVQAHLDLLAEEHIRQGMAPAEARQAARREFGGVDQVKEVYRDQRGLPLVDTIAQDLRYAVRTLAKNRGPAAVVVLTLALAIGASVVMFSAIDVVLRSLPIADRDRVAYLASTDPRSLARVGLSAPDFADWSAQNSSFQELAALAFGSLNLSGVNPPVRVSTIRASANLLSMWGAQPALGRSFRPEEDRPGGRRVVLLTNRFWRGQFSGDAAILGTTVMLDRESYTVVGVLPARMDVGVFKLMDVWVPLALDPGRARRDDRELVVTGLLKPGVSLEQGAGDVQAIARRLETQYPDTNSSIGALALPALDMFSMGNLRFVVGLMGGVAAILLFVACANVANVVLARATSRQRELALRAALGASRWRLIQQLMVEGLVSSSLAGTIGILLATWGVGAIRMMAADVSLIFGELTINGRVLGFGVLLALLTPFLFALLPAARSSTFDVRDGLGHEGRLVTEGRRGHRLRGMLVACQVALALMLLVEIGLLARTAIAFRNRELGFDRRSLLTLHIDLPGSSYDEPRKIRSFFDQALTRIGGLPGVRSVGAISRLPIADTEVVARFSIEGQTPPPNAQPSAARAIVNPAYRMTMAIPLIAGRDLAPADSADRPPVALVNQVMARRHWPNEDAIGKRIQFQVSTAVGASSSLASRDAVGKWIEIVGVVGDVRNSDVDAVPQAQVYVPSAQFPETAMAVAVRTEGSKPQDLIPAIRALVSGLDRDLPVYDAYTMEQVIFNDLGNLYIFVGVLAAIALMTVGLAASGIYGVISYTVGQRTRELGIRMALGAQPPTLVRMVLGQSFVPIVVGGFLGLAGGFALVRLTSGGLGEILAPAGPATYVALTVCLGLVALIASYVPARRVLRVDPVVALRHD